MRQLYRVLVAFVLLWLHAEGYSALAQTRELTAWQQYSPTSRGNLWAGTPSPTCVAITSDEQWSALWRTIAQSNHLSDTPPPVDFKASTLIYMSLGTQGTTGHAIVVNQIAESPDSVFVWAIHIEYASVADGCSPAACVLVPKLVKPVSFRILQATAQTGFERCR